MSHAQQAQIPGSFCFVRAYAKINLTLDVLGKRTDGYHTLATVMQTIDLYDTLCLTLTEDQHIEVHCTIPELSTSDNLVVHAAERILQHSTYRWGVRIELSKRIPVAAGLGGGSSDAAAVLLALQQWLQIPLSQEEMLALAASLGSDVPYFLTGGGLALCEGRGEVVTALPPRWASSMRWLVVLKPPIGLSTATVFRHLTADDYTNGRYSHALSATIRANASPQPEDLYNCLERGVLECYPEVARAKNEMMDAGAQQVQLSGSGPTLFAPFPELKAASIVQQRLQTQGYEVYLSRAIHPNSGNVCFF